MISMKAIATLVNKEKKLYICHDRGTQWIGTGAAMYPISNLPLMNTTQFATLMDIPNDTKTRNKYFISELDEGTFNFVSDNLDNAELVGINRWIFNRGSNSFIPLITTQGIMFLDNQYLGPIANSNMRNICECYNPDDDHHYIVVKEGLFVTAVIEPSGYVLDRVVQEELRQMLKSLDQGAYAERAHWLVVDAVPLESGDIAEQTQLGGRSEVPQLEGRVIHQLPAHTDDPPDGDVDDHENECPPAFDDECHLPEICRSCRWGHEAPPDGEDPCEPCDFGETPPSNYTPMDKEETA